jgi:hypothetical protein
MAHPFSTRSRELSRPIVAHWVRRAAVGIYRRLGLLTALPIAPLDRPRLEKPAKAIGKS